MLTARDIMSKDVISVTPDATIEETSELLTRYRIHGAPVVDEAGQLVGMVSLVDLVGRIGETVADVMSPDPVIATEDALVEELAGLMLEQTVRRIPIVEGGRVAGIVSASDIIRVFLNLHDTTGARRPVTAKSAPPLGAAKGGREKPKGRGAAHRRARR